MSENTAENGCENVCDENVLSGSMKKVTFKPSKEDDLWIFLHNNKKKIMETLENELKTKLSIKFYLCIQIVVKKYTITENGTDVKFEDLYRRTACVILLQDDNINDIIELGFNDIIKKVSDYHEHGSGWIIHSITKLELYFAKYKPFKGGTYIPTPAEFKKKMNYLVNVKNYDYMCFKWCVLAALYPPKHHPNRCKFYHKFNNKLNFSNISFPVKISKISLFEKLNNIGINVIGYDSPANKNKKELYPLYISKQRDASMHVNLLYITQGNKSHYILIKKLNAFLKTQHHSKHFCMYCFNGFGSKRLLDDHISFCKGHNAQKTVFPKISQRFLYFKDYSMVRRVPFVIYADFESVLLPVDTCTPKHDASSTTIKQIHVPCGYCIIVVGPSKIHKPQYYRGEDCIDHFFDTLFAWEKAIIKKLKTPVKMKMTEADKIRLRDAKTCYMCKKPFSNIFDPPVHDHDHVLGGNINLAHNSCNLNSKTKYFVPVIMHNLKSYDSHLLLKHMKSTDRRMNVIPSNKEKYISFSIGKLRFIDSYQFLPTSLETLVNNLVKTDKSLFKALHMYFDDDKVDLLLRKGVYPYSYCSSFEKFNETKLPPREAFYNDITKEELSESDYLHAKTVWNRFGIKTLGEYHDLYVKSDTISLCDVFEAFRSMAHTEYSLDPCHFYTTPGLSFSACLLMTGVKLELITCPTIYLFIESALRGGVSQICKRYSKANNPYLADYDSNKPTNYILYLDMNNLYGCGLGEYLPISDFCFLSQKEIDQLDICNIPKNSEYGYIIQCDLIYDKQYHDRDCDFPLAAERKKITKDMLSPYSLFIHDKLDTNIGNYEKLVPNLLDKHNYICHYRNLQLYIELGMKVATVSKVLRFKQEAWLKPYIDFNTQKRAQATNSFEKLLFKYMVNAVFGKSCQNNRKLVSIKLANSSDAAINILTKPNVKYWEHINEWMVLFHLSKINIKLDRPIYIGFTVLELSKYLMYSFHYKHIKAKYGKRATLLMMDTDSYVYDIETDDVYKDMHEDRHMYDFSDYDPSHFLYSDKNRKKVGFMKDELSGNIVKEFVALKPKMYSLISESSCIKRAKGVSKHIVQKVLKHEDYI